MAVDLEGQPGAWRYDENGYADDPAILVRLVDGRLVSVAEPDVAELVAWFNELVRHCQLTASPRGEVDGRVQGDGERVVRRSMRPVRRRRHRLVRCQHQQTRRPRGR